MASMAASGCNRPQILFIDAFDSFTNNIVGLLSQTLDVAITVKRMNEDIDDVSALLACYDAVVVGPGPGHPAKPEDIGFINRLWKLSDADIVPILGVCLGFQSLCHSQGAAVKELTRARHGIVSRVSHEGSDIFAGVKDLDATQYHSLKVDIGTREGVKVFYEPSEACPTLQPLAWDADDEINGPILMGVRHTEKPFWGVQFHPESICTSAAGQVMIQNWWIGATKWSTSRKRQATRAAPSSLALKPEIEQQSEQALRNGRQRKSLGRQIRAQIPDDTITLQWSKVDAPDVAPSSLVEALGQKDQGHGRREVVLLDSQGHKSGEFSIIGLVTPNQTMKVTYRVSEKTIRYGYTEGEMRSLAVDSIEDVWPLLQETLDLHEPSHSEETFIEEDSPASTPGDLDCRQQRQWPFWGGFMGYVSYEAGLETLDVESHPSCATGGVPDINFAFIHRSVVFDHATSTAYIQSLWGNDSAWIEQTKDVIERLQNDSKPTVDIWAESNGKRQKIGAHSTAAKATLEESAALSDALLHADIKRPGEMEYRNKVLRCQELLASGDSYELCLTDETQIHVPLNESGKGLNEWALYKRLRQNNPAPFGAYLNLSGVTVVGSSPERFLRWTRQGRCQFRPIKGTVKKGPDVTREQAHAILESSKERAENLMIVDLIRHDLSGVIGAESTSVPKLMVVEEYETVYQLVSVIEGQLPERGPGQPRGLDVLKRSLPPGSMTGAPKKRSCEILRDIEKRPRGVYSGVLGYMDVGGAGDFSVVIRTAMRNVNEGAMGANGTAPGDAEDGEHKISNKHEMWRVGAGGAVTIQSTDEGEFLEMEAKQSSVLGSLLRQKK